MTQQKGFWRHRAKTPKWAATRRRRRLHKLAVSASGVEATGLHSVRGALELWELWELWPRASGSSGALAQGLWELWEVGGEEHLALAMIGYLVEWSQVTASPGSCDLKEEFTQESPARGSEGSPLTPHSSPLTCPWAPPVAGRCRGGRRCAPPPRGRRGWRGRAACSSPGPSGWSAASAARTPGPAG